MEIDKSLMLDSSGRPLTQSLFLELGYNEASIYTLKEEDHLYNGVVFPSIKRLYLEAEDPTEYEFANKYFLNWKHWKRLCENKAIRKYIDEWREELEIRLRCKGVKEMIALASGDKGYQAAKWLVDKGWDVRTKGRPSKKEIEREKAFQARAVDEYTGDVVRLFGNE